MAALIDARPAPESGQTVPPKPWYRRLGMQVLAAMVLGIAVGFAFPAFGASLKFLGDMFLALIKAGVAPLVFLTVVTGIASAGDIKRAGRVGVRAVVYFEVISSIALVIGLFFANLLHLGTHMHAQASASAAAAASKAASGASTPSFKEFLLHTIPDNFIGAFAKGEMLQVVVLALIFGAGILTLAPERRARVSEGLDLVSETLFSFINIVMKFAPIGTFGAVAYSVGSNGSGVLLALAELVLSFYAVILFFVVVVLGLICRLSGFSLFRFLRFIKEEVFIVLGTASSESALPGLLRKLEQFGCSKQTVGLVLPTGYAFNLDGTSIYMSMGVLFIANAFGVPLGLEQQLGILALMLLTSKGAATVSGGSFVVFAATVTATGILPPDGLALLFGVYRFMSIAIATCNTIGNSVATVVIAKWANDFDADRAREALAAADASR